MLIALSLVKIRAKGGPSREERHYLPRILTRSVGSDRGGSLPFQPTAGLQMDSKPLDFHTDPKMIRTRSLRAFHPENEEDRGLKWLALSSASTEIP